MITSEKIRELRKKFWESPEKKHKLLPPDKLVPTQGDTTAMFTLAGMQQLVPYLMGKPHPLGKRLYNIQKCIRTNDIEEVGDERHLTFFEMMGNWSLGDYFKEESIKWSIEFLTKYLNIPLEKLGATVFKGEENIPQDKESINIWQKYGVSKEKIKALGKDDNFRGPAGEVGPCGPCTEIYFDRGPLWGPEDWNLGFNDRYLEIRNNVFMEYYKDKEGNYKKLSQKNVDTGMGLERITMVMQGVPTVFETDLFEPILEKISEFVKIDYPLKSLYWKKIGDLSDSEKLNFIKDILDKVNSDKNLYNILRRFRIIADHIRSSVFLIADGVTPSNEGRGYVLRRLIRRLYYNLILLKQLDKNSLKEFVDSIVDVISTKYGQWRPEVNEEKETVKKILLNEIIKFEKTILRGLNIINNLIVELNKNKDNIIPANVVFNLYDTYGFPVELIEEIGKSYGLNIDKKGFNELMEKARVRSREATKNVFKRGIDWSKYIEGLPQTEFIGYDDLETTDVKLLKDFEIEINGKNVRILVFDKTPFYAESGGQTGDKGKIILDNGEELEVYDVQKYAGVYLHFVR